jgi:hypothetical protein
MIVKFIWRRPFVILKTGIKLDGLDLPWDKVVSCHWMPSSPGILSIRADTNQTHLTVWVPERLHTRVEAALRRFGKWED